MAAISVQEPAVPAGHEQAVKRGSETVKTQLSKLTILQVVAGSRNGGEFGIFCASCGAVENVIPVDMKIPGFQPTSADLVNSLTAVPSR